MATQLAPTLATTQPPPPDNPDIDWNFCEYIGVVDYVTYDTEVRRIARPVISQISKQQVELEAPPMLITEDGVMDDSGKEASSVGSYGCCSG